MYRKLLLLAVILLASISTPAAPPALADTQAGIPVLFPETGHTLAYSFRLFYERQGGLTIFGMPITEVYLEDGIPVQYFERARFEWHASIAQVQLGHLGRWSALRYEGNPAFVWQTQGRPGALFFAESGHSLGGAFATFWQNHGGLPTFGYPISEEFAEQDPTTGKTYAVQYFERARFEYHPENTSDYAVLPGHLGREYLVEHPAPDWAVQPVSSADVAWNAIRPTHIRIPRIAVDTDVTETGFSYQEWDVPRYTAGHYWPVSAFPNTIGNTVIAGHVGYHDTIFNKLPDVQHGDEVFVTVSGQEYRYIVQEVLLLEPAEVWVMNPTPTETLTLITCVPIGVYSHRLVVRAAPG